MASSINQLFSFSDSIIYYITKYPSTPKVYLKLKQCCKYFFKKHPIIVVAHIYNGGKTLCSSNDHDECRKKKEKCCIKIDIEKLACKIWLTKQVIQHCDQNIAAIICSKIYRCENAEFQIWSGRMSFDVFKIWGSVFQKFFTLGTTIITDNDGSAVMLEKILEFIPNVKEFTYNFGYKIPAATATTMKDIAKLKNLNNLQFFRLKNIPEIIPVQDFADFIENNKDKEFMFEFHWNISPEYKNQLDAFVDSVIQSNIPNCVIHYRKQDSDKLLIMQSRR